MHVFNSNAVVALVEPSELSEKVFILFMEFAGKNNCCLHVYYGRNCFGCFHVKKNLRLSEITRAWHLVAEGFATGKSDDY